MKKQSMAPTREVTARKTYGLYMLTKEPDDSTAQRETVEHHNLERAIHHFSYSDSRQGHARTYDPTGAYLCGGCNMAATDADHVESYEGGEDEPAAATECLLLKIKQIDPVRGGCADWESICAGDPEAELHLKSPEAAYYGELADGAKWGCSGCPFSKPAIRPDSAGRTLYCGKFDCRVETNACCALNGAKTRKIPA